MTEKSRGIGVYLERRVLAILFLGFSSGIPLALVYATLSAWLEEEGVSKTTIGLFGMASSAYALKYLWSPLVDRLPIPLLSTLVGRRRSWMLLSQAAVIVAIARLGSTNPSESLFQTALWAVILAFASATQDIVVDAYRVEILEERQLGAGSANYVFGYRIAMLVSGAGALLLADYYNWFVAYAAMALAMGVGVVTVLLNPEPRVKASRTSVEQGEKVRKFLEERAHLPRPIREALAWIYGAVVLPFAEFMTRPGWVVILLFVGLYKYADALLGNMANPFYLEIGFSKTEIALVSKGYGLAMTLLGTFLGGVLVARVGILKSLLVGGVLQGASNLIFAVQAWVGPSIGMLTVTISVENFAGGLGTAAFVAYLSALCDVAYTATQYALLSSFMAATRTWLSAAGGWLADQMSWVWFFVLTTGAAIPGLVLLLILIRRYPPPRHLAEGAELLDEVD